MGLFFRKSVKLGPFRLNFSKSGVGVSAGVKGFRVSTGPRGTHLHAGRKGVYYRTRLDGPPNRGSKGRAPQAARTAGRIGAALPADEEARRAT